MLTAVTTAIASVLLLLIGLPLLAWWLGGRRFWGRLQPGRGSDPWGDFVRRHRLSAAEQFQVREAVNRGRSVQGDRLRRAVVDLAEETSAQLRLSWSGGSRLQGFFLLLALLWFVLLVANVVFSLATGGLADVPWLGIVTIAVVVGTPLWQRRTLRRAIELNRGPAA
jgi:hypothetical protein